VHVTKRRSYAVGKLYAPPSPSVCNHLINWSDAKILEKEGHRKTRQVKESIWIWKEPNCMNRDGGAYSLLVQFQVVL